jgi:hypothetical protein
MPRLIRGVARTAAIAGTATAVSGRVAHRQQGRWAEQEQQAAAPQAPPPPAAYAAPPAPPPPAAAEGVDMDAKIAQLKELGALKDAGVLTEVEFAVQKDRILNG